MQSRPHARPRIMLLLFLARNSAALSEHHMYYILGLPKPYQLTRALCGRLICAGKVLFESRFAAQRESQAAPARARSPALSGPASADGLKPLNRSQRPNAISKITIGKSNQDAPTVSLSDWLALPPPLRGGSYRKQFRMVKAKAFIFHQLQ